MEAAKGSLPQSDNVRFGVLWLPALGVAARHYKQFSEALSARGVAFECVEWRGTGASPQRADRRQDWGYRELLLDSAEALGSAQSRNPDRVWLLGGHSMGGQLAALLASIAGTGDFGRALRPHGLILVATGLPYWRLYSGYMRWGVRAFATILGALTAVIGHFPGRALRFAGREARGVMRDWRHSAIFGSYAARGVQLDLDAALRGLTIPVCAISLQQDSLAPITSMEGLLAKMPRAIASRTLLGLRELRTTADHFGWLKKPDAIVETIAAWTSSLGSRSTHPGAG